MHRVASALLATLLIAPRLAGGYPAPDSLLQDPMRFLDTVRSLILVRVLESSGTPEHTTATLRVIKSWKGPYSVGRILHVEEPAIVSCAVPCTAYVFKPDDKELLIASFNEREKDPLVVWDGWVWSAAESRTQALMDALNKAVVQCPSCAKSPAPSR
jgi:hypothetical protein